MVQSVKNTAVSIVLLFLSYGVYLVITNPLPDRGRESALLDLKIEEPDLSSENSADVQDWENPSDWDNHSTDEGNQDQIPLEILNHKSQTNSVEPRLEAPLTMASTTRSAADPSPRTNQNDAALQNLTSNLDIPFDEQKFGQFDAPNDAERMAGTDFNSPPPLPELASSDYSGPASPTPSDPPSSTEFDPKGSFELNKNFQPNPHFEADSQLMPTTVLAPISDRPQNSLPEAGDHAEMDARPPRRSLAETWPIVREMVQREDYRSALAELTPFYRDQNISDDDRQQLFAWLDPLAAKVIYSSENHLHSMPYIIQPGDTIASLARQWKVPAQLIYNVNLQKIPDPADLVPGVEIKIVQGPFDAEIDARQSVMTLFLDGLYAGRFEIMAPADLPGGELQIVNKSANEQPDRPFQISLSNGVSIFASEQTPNNQNEIGMSLQEAEDLFSILSASSTVKILR